MKETNNMKKLMIAAAAAAMFGGVYASEECPTCGQGEAAAATYNPAFYDVTFKLKTLTTKKVTCGKCELLCMESGNRTLSGLYWTCDNCYNGTKNKPGYQFALWEKATSICYGDQVVYDRWNVSEKWSVEASYLVTGNVISDYKYDSPAAATQAGIIDGFKTNEMTIVYNGSKFAYRAFYVNAKKTYTVGKEYTSEAIAKAAPEVYGQQLAAAKGWVVTLDPSTVKATLVSSEEGDCYWVANASPFSVLLRYGKSGEKVEAYANEAMWSDFAGTYGDLTLAFAGFGSYDTKNLRIKSISGYAVGLIDPNAICGNQGEYADLCDEIACNSTECWAGSGIPADDTNTAFTGTWSMKLNTKYNKKGMENIVPSYVLGTGTCAQ